MLLKPLKWALMYMSVTLLACGPAPSEYSTVEQQAERVVAHKYDEAQSPKVNQTAALANPQFMNLQKQASDLEQELMQILQQQGSQAMARYLRFRADQGF